MLTMRLPAHPCDYATLVVSLSQMADMNIIFGSYEGCTLFADRWPSIEQMNRRQAAILDDLRQKEALPLGE